jgi:demethylmenaquinone methyltransferase/2-methoxy-6-polyprenyl-1,4-benzoquinol methylase
MNLKYNVISKFYGLLDLIYFRNINKSPRTGMLEFIPNKKIKILDVCIGTAENSILISINRPNAEIIGIDLSKDMLALAKEKIEKKGISNIKTLVMDAANMKLDDNYFDVVIISLVLHEVDVNIRDRIIKESKRVLKNQGKIIIIEWDKPRKLIQRLLFSIIKLLLEPKGFKEFLELNIKKYMDKFSLKVMSEKKCDYTRVIEIIKRD